MTEVERIADQLQRSMEGKAWHGPALLEVLEGVTAQQAAAPVPAAHTIWEVVLHVAAWISASRRRIQGDAALLTAEEDWPAIDGRGEGAWFELRAALEREYRDLLSVVRALPEEALEFTVRGQDYSTYFLLHGVIQHILYHAGQIAVARKIQVPGGDQARAMLRHTVATLAYRASKALRGAPDGFGELRASDTTRTPLQILAHLGDLLDWALATALGKPSWSDSAAHAWEEEKTRFFHSLQAFEDYLASQQPLHVPAEKLFQGPIADALAHVGQIAMLRRVANAPIRGENYMMAEIVPGRVGADQAPPRREFD